MYDPPRMENNVNCESYWAMKHEKNHLDPADSLSSAGAWPPACQPGFRLREG